ncbi:type II secretion system F family protein [Tissierella sp. Yu-01]|uniref:type II secretion system F family protein n=1 Tax=Tissierella sp. Yu-01 TaxID=3035694 RepID=UPI00240D9CBA|nr:type II secretion system F family protein [Tissierella sp. Yu-01]WFA09674.1 type II secretion system F family protein [Tissierella sp. Yu-01]
MRYKYKAIAKNGQMVEGTFEAGNESDVVAMIKGNNNLPLSIERDIETEASVELFSPRIKKKDLAVFCRQFYTMIDAGLGIVKCLDILATQTQNRTLKKIISQLYEDVQKGLTLSESMKKHDKVLPSILINMVEAGEVSGSLDTIMERISEHFEKENKIENKVKSSMIYPAALAVVSVVVVIFMLVFVMPTFISMFEGNGTQLPAPTRILIGLSNSLQSYWYLYFIGGFVLTSGLLLFKNTKEGRRLLDTLKLKIPVVKSTTEKIITSRFTRTLSTLISAGIPLIQSIEVVSRVVNNAIVQERLISGIENIRKGIPLSRAVKDVGVFPPMVDSMIRIGEESGSLDEILYKTADFYDEEVESSLQRLTALLEPIMLILMALIIGFIVVAMYMPMFEMVNTI